MSFGDILTKITTAVWSCECFDSWKNMCPWCLQHVKHALFDKHARFYIISSDIGTAMVIIVIMIINTDAQMQFFFFSISNTEIRTDVSLTVCSHLTAFVPGVSLRSTVTLTKLKWYWKLNILMKEWLNEYWDRSSEYLSVARTDPLWTVHFNYN